MKLLRLVNAVGLFCCMGWASAAQSQQRASLTKPPDLLVFVHQEFQFGKEAERQRLEAAVSRACDKVDVPNLWIVMESVTGKPEVLSFDPFDSFAEIDDAAAAWPQIYASHPELGRLQQQIRSLETNERSIVAARRSDLSYQSGSIDLSKARFMRILEVRVRPGHDDDFAEAFKTLRAAYLKINANLAWVVYQVNVGMPSPAYLVFVPMRELKQNDDLLSWRGILSEAEGDVGSARMQQIARDAYISSESNLYAINPQVSHVSKEFAIGDPEFWSPKAASSSAQPKRKDDRSGNSVN